ncbi:hypothetical protein BDW22DRAFT_1338408 [Trametopsis cervina]|nr:hypothetical protein BDW22DRAFT_1338408 [Trametopsis cervina]
MIHIDNIDGHRTVVHPFDPSEGTEREEVVVNVQGYILRCNLPPIYRSEQLPKNTLAAKQSVMLTGLNCEAFNTAGRAIIEIHSYLSSTLPDGSLQAWTPAKDEGSICLEFSNRYFMSGDRVDELDSIPFTKEVDPKGILHGHMQGLAHTEENEVLYFEKSRSMDLKTYTYTACHPISIRPGQLVELQVTFGTVPISKGRHIMLSKIRSICIISRQVQDVSKANKYARVQSIQDINTDVFDKIKNPPVSPLKKVKRRVGYMTSADAANETAGALKRLRLTDSSSDIDKMTDE